MTVVGKAYRISDSPDGKIGFSQHFTRVGYSLISYVGRNATAQILLCDTVKARSLDMKLRANIADVNILIKVRLYKAIHMAYKFTLGRRYPLVRKQV